MVIKGLEMHWISKLILIIFIFYIVLFLSCKKNTPPNTPSTPNGPDNSPVKVKCRFSISTTDPDQDSICYISDWGDDKIDTTHYFYPSGDSVSIFHSWSFAGNYTI